LSIIEYKLSNNILTSFLSLEDFFTIFGENYNALERRFDGIRALSERIKRRVDMHFNITSQKFRNELYIEWQLRD